MSKVVLSLSGGLDSTTLLAYAKNKGYEVITIAFKYSSKHNLYERAAAMSIANHFQVQFRVVDLSGALDCMKSDLLKSGGEIPEGHYEAKSMQRTVVPGRNLIFASVLAGIAWSEGADQIYLGVHAGDHCLPARTPVATHRGLVPIQDLRIGEDEVMSFDPATKSMCWRKVTNKVEVAFPREVLRLTTQSGAVIDCTEDHKVYLVQRSDFTTKLGWQKSLTQKKAGDIRLGDMLLTPGGALDSTTTPFRSDDEMVDMLSLIPDLKYLNFDEESVWFKSGNKVNRRVPLSDVVKLIGWYVTEGSGTYRDGHSRSNQFGVYISQSATENPDNLTEIVEVATRWGFRPAIHGEDKSNVYFSGPTAKALLDCGRKSREKEIPGWVMALPNSLLQVLFDVMIHGDGHWKADHHQQFITTSTTLINQMAYIGNRLGFKSSVGRMVSDDCYQVNFYRSEVRPNLNRYGESAYSPVVKIERVPNFEPVYDITVEDTHNFFAGSTVPVLVSNCIYPDCRPDFIHAMRDSVYRGTDCRVHLMAPFLYMTKDQIVKEGLKLGVPFQLTRTCYRDQTVACGKCGSCQERLTAFSANGTHDPIPYESRVLLPKEVEA